MRIFGRKILFVSLVFYFISSAALAKKQDQDNLLVAIPNPIINTEPQKVAIAQERFILSLIYEGLFKLNEDGAITPELAESWTFDRSHKELSVVIRPKHKFSDGSNVTTADIVRSFQILCSKESRIRDLLDDLAGCIEGNSNAVGIRESTDRTSVIFQLKFDPSSFLYRIASLNVSVFKIASNGSTIGSGPYRVDSKLANEATIVPNEFMKRTPKEAKHDKITFRYYDEKNIAQTLDAGTVDVAAMYLSSTGAKIHSEAYNKHFHSASVTQTLVVNPKFAAFKDKNRRQELHRQISDIQKIEQCSPGTTSAIGFIPPGIGGSLNKKPNISSTQKALSFPKLSAADSIVTIYEHIGRASTCDQERITKAMASVGLQANFQYEKSYAEMSPREGHPKTGAYIELFLFPSRDAGAVFRRFLPGDGNLFFFYTKPLYVELLHRAMGLPNLSDRFEIYRELDRDIFEESIMIPMYHVGHVNFVKSCIQIPNSLSGVLISPNSFSYLEKISRGDACK